MVGKKRPSGESDSGGIRGQEELLEINCPQGAFRLASNGVDLQGFLPGDADHWKNGVYNASDPRASWETFY